MVVKILKNQEKKIFNHVFEKAKSFNSSKEFKDLREQFLGDVRNIKSYEAADVFLKTYLKSLNDLFCRDCMLLTLLASNTQEYHEFRNKPLEGIVPALDPKNSKCVICLDSLYGTYSKARDALDNSYDLSDLSDLRVCRECINVFHKDCIWKWIKESEFCPICKRGYSHQIQVLDRDVMEDKKIKYFFKC